MRSIRVRSHEQRQLIDITERVMSAVREEGEGVWMVYVPHTTAGVAINEGADPSVAVDIVPDRRG